MITLKQVYVNLDEFIKNNIVSWKDVIGKIIKFKYNNKVYLLHMENKKG